MYLIKEKSSNDIKKFRTKFYAEKTGLTPNYISAILNSKMKCTKTGAKAILSVCFNISFSDKQMEELLEEYFEEE